MKLSKLTQQRRWNAAKLLVTRIKDIAAANKALLLYDGDAIRPDQLVITDTEIFVSHMRSISVVYDSDDQLDEGIYSTITETDEYIRSMFKIVVELGY